MCRPSESIMITVVVEHQTDIQAPVQNTYNVHIHLAYRGLGASNVSVSANERWHPSACSPGDQGVRHPVRPVKSVTVRQRVGKQSAILNLKSISVWTSLNESANFSSYSPAYSESLVVAATCRLVVLSQLCCPTACVSRYADHRRPWLWKCHSSPQSPKSAINSRCAIIL